MNDILAAIEKAAGALRPAASAPTPKTNTVLAPAGTIVMARLAAIDGEMNWQVPPMTTPCLADVVLQGHAAILYDGNRAPKSAPCVSCKRLTSKAWYIHPIDFTVPGCDGEHVADAIEKLWQDTYVIRVTGERAKRMIHRAEVAA